MRKPFHILPLLLCICFLLLSGCSNRYAIAPEFLQGSLNGEPWKINERPFFQRRSTDSTLITVKFRNFRGNPEDKVADYQLVIVGLPLLHQGDTILLGSAAEDRVVSDISLYYGIAAGDWDAYTVSYEVREGSVSWIVYQMSGQNTFTGRFNLVMDVDHAYDGPNPPEYDAELHFENVTFKAQEAGN